MAKKSYFGDPDSLSKLIPNIGYVGDSQNKSKRLLKGYVGNAQNKAKLFWEYITGIVKEVFTVMGFMNKDFTIYTSIGRYGNISNNSKYGDYTISGVNDKLILDNLFDYYNKIESKNEVITPSNNLTYNTYYSPGIISYELFVPANEQSFIYVPTAIYGVSKLVFDIVSEDDGLIVVGAASRLSDDEAQGIYKYFGFGEVNNSSISITVNVNNAKIDYILFGVDEVQGKAPSFSIRKITATYERCYGVVEANSQTYYVNNPRYAFIYIDQYDYAISAAESAVYMIAFNSTNQYTSKIYTDDNDTFGQGTTYFLFISKKAFSLSYISQYGPDGTTNSTSTSLDGKTTHYILRTLSNQAGWGSGYNYAYSYYDGQTINASKIALIGKECLYDNVIQ